MRAGSWAAQRIPPHAYKDIESVMAAQSDLVRPLARFTPRLVKMAPDGERPED